MVINSPLSYLYEDCTTIPSFAAKILEPYPQPAMSIASCNAPHLYPNGLDTDEHVAGHPHSPAVATTVPYPL